MKIRGIINSFNYAVTGILQAMKTEKNLRFQYITAIAVILFSLFFDFSRLEFLILLVTIAFVLITEMLNTAIEKTIDIITKDYHPLAKIAKDVAAGAVLISAVNAIVVGYLLFFDRLNPIANYVLFKIKSNEIHLTFVALLLVTLLTIGFKARFYKGRGTHFQGGTVSGHSAISFCVATIISFLANHILVTTLSFGLALLVGESRIEGKIHSLLEVVYGAILGTLVGILVFQIIG